MRSRHFAALAAFLMFCAGAYAADRVQVQLNQDTGQPVTQGGVADAAKVTLSTLLSCEDQALSSCWVSLGGSSVNLTQATTSNQVKAAAGEVIGFFVNTTNSGTLRFWDQVGATCNSGAKGATITPAAGAWYTYPVKFSTGICVLTGGTGIDVTVVYR
ncbi:MAG: hypothetical protein HY749_16270 [Gammaproteobacteria bacterium]|nr:hypothetical protein [Gammaproteobacteria bacterium]